jgi:hypothetical protein
MNRKDLEGSGFVLVLDTVQHLHGESEGNY